MPLQANFKLVLLVIQDAMIVKDTSHNLILLSNQKFQKAKSVKRVKLMKTAKRSYAQKSKSFINQ
jgi:hypothetical protein